MKLSPRERNLEEVLDIMPINETPPQITGDDLPILVSQLDDLEIKSLEGEVETLYKLAKSGIDIKDRAMEELENCDFQEDKSSFISSATTALSASINAIDKATRIKMQLIKLKGVKKPEVDDAPMSREEVLDAIRQHKGS